MQSTEGGLLLKQYRTNRHRVVALLALITLVISITLGANADNTVSSATKNKVIVIYFSCTGTTEKVAQWVAEEGQADLYRIYPAIPYTEDDLKYYTNCRADQEQSNDNARPEIGNLPDNLSQYDVIFLGYPIWHAKAPKIIYTLLESVDISGKRIIPFCTSASSGLGQSAVLLQQLTNETVTWETGKRFAKTASEDSVKNWVDSFDLPDPIEVGRTINVTVSGVTKSATLSDNASADAFYGILQDGPITVNMHDYGNFEKVGPLGQSIVRSDERITTVPGDIILYLGNQITIYYATNTYTFTLLGHIDGATHENMLEFLNEDNPVVTFSIEMQLTEVIRLPSDVVEIQNEAFAGTDADRYEIPYGAHIIGSKSFSYLKRTAIIVIPSSVVEIAEDAFSGSRVSFVCESGSLAEEYAQQHGIPVVQE